MAYQTYNYNYAYNNIGSNSQTSEEQTQGAYRPHYHYQAAQNAGFNFSNDDGQPRVLYVGNLDPSVTEDFIGTLFGQIGPIAKTKVIFDTGSDPYAFVEFAEHHAATQALQAMNKRVLLDREMKVNWATQPGSQQKIDTSLLGHYHVFVGDLSPEVDNKTLKEAFVPFGEVSDAKVIRDPQTMKPKGYGFVSYPKREEAERAIEQMNGQWLGRRTIRTNWATRKPNSGEFDHRIGIGGIGIVGGGGNGVSSSGAATGNSGGGIGVPMSAYGGQGGHAGRSSLEEIMKQSDPKNCSVYIGNIPANATDDDVRSIFKRFGNVLEIRHFKNQGYSFVKFDSNDNAARAIYEMNGAELMGQAIRCSWGKIEGPRGQHSDHGSSAIPPIAYANAFPTEAAQQQQQQYWQYYQHYYNNPAVQQQWQAYWNQANMVAHPQAHTQTSHQ